MIGFDVVLDHLDLEIALVVGIDLDHPDLVPVIDFDLGIVLERLDLVIALVVEIGPDHPDLAPVIDFDLGVVLDHLVLVIVLVAGTVLDLRWRYDNLARNVGYE